MDKPPVSGEEVRPRSIENRPCRWDRISGGDIPSEHGPEIVARSRLFLRMCFPVEVSSDRRGESPKRFRRIVASKPKDALVPSTIVARRRREPSLDRWLAAFERGAQSDRDVARGGRSGGRVIARGPVRHSVSMFLSRE